MAATSTGERTLRNFGKIKITAEPHVNGTVYYLAADKPLFDGERISKLSKETGLQQKELELFGGKEPGLKSVIPNRLIVELPCTESSVCTKYMNIFIEWLDSEYFKTLPKIEDFEEPIQQSRS